MDNTTAPLASIGIDIGKEVFHIVGFSTDGSIAFRRKIKRLALVETFKRLPPSVVGMEACLSAHLSAGRGGSLAMSRGLSRRSM
jgi:transposase